MICSFSFIKLKNKIYKLFKIFTLFKKKMGLGLGGDVASDDNDDDASDDNDDGE